MKNATFYLFLILLIISFAVTAQAEKVNDPYSYESERTSAYVTDNDKNNSGDTSKILSERPPCILFRAKYLVE